MIAGALLGERSTQLAQNLKCSNVATSTTYSAAARAAGAVFGGAASLLYYGGLLRTPSYNWVTVFGATTAAVGTVWLLSHNSSLERHAHKSPGLQSRDWSSMVVIAAGLFFSLPAKPTTALWYTVLALPLFTFWCSFRKAAQILLSVAAGVVILLSVAISTQLWPIGFVEVFLRAVMSPALLPVQTITGAFGALSPAIEDLADSLLLRLFTLSVAVSLATLHVTRRCPQASLWLHSHTKKILLASTFGPVFVIAGARVAIFVIHSSNLFAALGLMSERRSLPLESYNALLTQGIIVLAPWFVIFVVSIVGTQSRIRYLFPTCLAVAALDLPRMLITLITSGPSESLFVHKGLFVDFFIVFCLLTYFLFASLVSMSRNTPWGDQARTTVLGVFLMLFAVSTGFGSSHGLIRQAALTSTLLTGSLVLQIVPQVNQQLRIASYTIVGCFLVLYLTVHSVFNAAQPYRLPPLTDQTEAVHLELAGSRLWVDAGTAALLSELQGVAISAGWRAGTPLVPVASRWSSTIPYVLQARVPDSLMLTIGGYGDASENLLRFNTEWTIQGDFADAWFLVSAPSHERHLESIRWAEYVAQQVGREFPDDYTLVYVFDPIFATDWVLQNGRVELWSPLSRD